MSHRFINSLLLVTSLLIGCAQDGAKKIVLNNLEAEVTIHNPFIESFLEHPDDEHLEARGNMEFSKPIKTKLSWKSKNISKEDGFKIFISENENLTGPYVINSEITECEITNLKLDTRYYWQVSSNTVFSKVESFKTENHIARIIDIDGVTNCRDLGGYDTLYGKKVKQGLIYRTGRLNVSDTSEVIPEITEKGKDTLINQLHMKTEIDLRGSGKEVGGLNNQSIVDGLNYYNIPMTYSGSLNCLLQNSTKVKQVFEDVLSKEESYPLFFHCNIGTDRTGMLAYTLLTLLGVNKENAICDYLLSNYGKIGSGRLFKNIENSYPATYEDGIGKNLSEKVQETLMDVCNIEQETINKVKTILLEQ